MKTWKTILWMVGISLCLLTSCKTTKQASTVRNVPTTTDSITTAGNYHEQIKGLTAQFKMQLLGNKLFSLSGTIESVTDQELMVSVKALFGIEVIRIYCTPDHAILVDRIGKRICSMPFSELASELGTDFYGLQGLLTNRLFDPDRNNFANFTLDVVGSDWMLTHNGKYQTEFLLQGGKFLQRSIIRSFSKGDYLMATYSNLQLVQEYEFPMSVQYVYYSKERSNSVDVTFQSISFNQKSELNWQMPSGYKTVTVEELQKELLTL